MTQTTYNPAMLHIWGNITAEGNTAVPVTVANITVAEEEMDIQKVTPKKLAKRVQNIIAVEEGQIVSIASAAVSTNHQTAIF